MTDKEMYSKHRWLMLLCSSIAIASIYIDMIVYSPILGNVAKSLNVEMGAATNLMMGFVLSIACVLIWGGVVCDKYGITTALVLGLLCASIPPVLMPMFGESYSAVFFGRLVQGASVGFIFGTIGPISALWFPPEEQGLAGGIMFGSLSLGSTIGVVFSPALYASMGSWEMVIAIMSIPGWIGIVIALLFSRRAPSQEVLKSLQARMAAADGQGDMTFGKALTLPVTWIGALLGFTNAWGMYCLYNLVPPYLAAPSPMGVGLSPVAAGKLSLALTSVGIFAPFLGGLFFDKVAKSNPRPGVIIGFVLSGLFTYLLLINGVTSNMGLLIICLMLAGWGIPFMNPSLSAYIAMKYPPTIVGRMVGWWFGFGTFGGALGIFLGGKTIDANGTFFWALTMISIASIAGLILIFFIGKKKDKVPEKKAATVNA